MDVISMFEVFLRTCPFQKVVKIIYLYYKTLIKSIKSNTII